jgi:hypothetical protein
MADTEILGFVTSSHKLIEAMDSKTPVTIRPVTGRNLVHISQIISLRRILERSNPCTDI